MTVISQMWTTLAQWTCCCQIFRSPEGSTLIFGSIQTFL